MAKVNGATPAVVVTVTEPLFTDGQDVAPAVPLAAMPVPVDTTTFNRLVVQPFERSLTRMVNPPAARFENV